MGFALTCFVVVILPCQSLIARRQDGFVDKIRIEESRLSQSIAQTALTIAIFVANIWIFAPYRLLDGLLSDAERKNMYSRQKLIDDGWCSMFRCIRKCMECPSQV